MDRLRRQTFEQWLDAGMKRGWISPPLCETHDGWMLTSAEEEEFEQGSDPCIHVIRLFDSREDQREAFRRSQALWHRFPEGFDHGKDS